MKKNITAKEIAAICGVSQATVSYVINNRTDKRISQDTRDKILDAIETYHYVPNEAARNMRNNKGTSIGIVCEWDYSRQSFLSTMEGISHYLEKMNYTLTLFYEKKSDDEKSYIKSYQSHLIDGLIFIADKDHDRFIEPAEANNIPYVVICMDGVFSRHSPKPTAFGKVLEDCVRLCKEKNLHSIRYFSVEHNGIFVEDEYAQFNNITKSLFPDCDLQHVIIPVTNRNTDQLTPFILEYMDSHTFDIAISPNYDVGLLIQREILRRHPLLPQHPKNIFLNDVDFYAVTYPSITGIHIPFYDMGMYSAKLILSIIEGTEPTFAYQQFSCRLVHRESTQ